MKYKIFGILLLASEVCFSQGLTVEEIRDSTLMFPVIRSAQRPAVASKINEVLKADWHFDEKAKNPFAETDFTGEESFSYEVTVNNNRVFGMNIQSSYAACGLHITRQSYIFETRSGTRVDMASMFGNDGQARLKKALFKSWKAACKAAAADSNAQDYYVTQYKECLVAAEKQNEVEVSRMSVIDKGINFWAGSCLEGTAYDFEADATQGPHFYSAGQLLPMLTRSGFLLFFDVAPNAFQTLMRGTIDGKYAISLALLPGKEGSAADAVGGMIVYDRVGQPINVTGTFTGNQIVFHELDESGNALSDIEVTWDGTKLTGMFTNLKTKKQMPFVASAVK